MEFKHLVSKLKHQVLKFKHLVLKFMYLVLKFKHLVLEPYPNQSQPPDSCILQIQGLVVTLLIIIDKGFQSKFLDS